MKERIRGSSPQTNCIGFDRKCILSLDMKMDMDMEDDIDFCISLDKNGRTTFSGGDSSIDYRCKSVLLREFAQHELDDLLLDAEIADCALLPRTFWVGKKGLLLLLALT